MMLPYSGWPRTMQAAPIGPSAFYRAISQRLGLCGSGLRRRGLFNRSGGFFRGAAKCAVAVSDIGVSR